jgi:hypothetical protein
MVSLWDQEALVTRTFVVSIYLWGFVVKIVLLVIVVIELQVREEIAVQAKPNKIVK